MAAMHVTTHDSTCPVWAQKPRRYGVPPGSRLEGRRPWAEAAWSLDTVARVLFEPRLFFAARRERHDMASAAAFAMMHAAVVTAVGYAAWLLGRAAHSPVPPTAVDAVRTLSACAVVCVVAAFAALAGTIAIAAAVHPFVRVLNGRGGMGATYEACVYGLAPLAVMASAAFGIGELGLDGTGASAWLLVVGCAWSVGLIYVAVAEGHPLADWAAFLATCVPAALLLSAAVPVLSVEGKHTLPSRVEAAARTVLGPEHANTVDTLWARSRHRVRSVIAGRRAALPVPAPSHARPRR